MTTNFSKLSVGTRFEFRGRRYEKVNSEIARDEERGGNAFHGGTEVTAELQTAKGAKYANHAKAERPKPRSFTTDDAEYAEAANRCKPPVVRPKKQEPLEGTFLRQRRWAEERIQPEPFIEEGFAFAPRREVYEGRLGRGRDRGLRAFGTV
jgi:hypothetical protein